MGDVSVEGKIGGIDEDAPVAEKLLPLEGGGPHGDAELFGLFGAGDNAAVIIREDDYGLAPQLGIKDPFARDEKGVAVDQEEPLSELCG